MLTVMTCIPCFYDFPDDNVQEPLSGELLKNLEYRFHKATLETYDEVVTGLTTVAQYLIEVRMFHILSV